MASYPNKRKSNKPFLFKSQNPHFFKIILDHQQAKLGIPRKFARFYGHHLSSPVILKVPSGAKWPVELVKTSSGEIWLHNGWLEFADFYSISYGSLLVFEYDKNNGEFNVIIFDMSATEIDYPLTSFSNGDPDRADNLDQEQVPNVVLVDEAQDDDDDVSVQILDDLSPSTKTKAKSPITLPSKLNKKIKLKTCVQILNRQSPTTHQNQGNRKQTIEEKSRCKEQKPSFSNPPGAKRAAKELSAANPCFQARISSDSLKRGRLFVTTSFVKNMEQGPKATMLEVNNRLWPVRMHIYKYRAVGVFVLGWDAFAKDNSLKFGDVCTFEMINNSDQTLLMKVSITRDSVTFLSSNGDNEMPESKVHTAEQTKTVKTVEIPSKRKDRSLLSCSWPHKKSKKVENFTNMTGKGPNVEKTKEKGNKPGQERMTNTIITRKKPCLTLKENSKDIHRPSSSFKSDIPTFEIKMQPSYVHHCKGSLVIPVSFAKKYMRMKYGDALFNVLDNKTWSVKFYTKRKSGSKQSRTRLIHYGWQEFAHDNHLQVGDVCRFELIDPCKTLFKVFISRSTTGANVGSRNQFLDMKEHAPKPSCSDVRLREAILESVTNDIKPYGRQQRVSTSQLYQEGLAKNTRC